jgi:hypothetical protein
LFFDRSISLTKNISSSFYAVLATHFIELDSSSTISSPTCHSARRACPKLQNPLPHFVKKKLLPGDKVPARADEGCEKVLFTGPLPPSATAPLLRRARVILWMMDSATSPSASRRMTGWCGVLRRVKVFGLAKPTERKSDAVCIVIGLMLCALVFD